MLGLILISVSPRKPISKLLGIWTILLFFILKGAFPKPAYAFVSSLDACAAKPECAAAISSELAPAIAAPTAEGVSATIGATTATGATTTQVAAGVAVVGDMRLSGVVAYYIWKSAQNQQAQEKARQRYCTAYPQDSVCGSLEVFTYYNPGRTIGKKNVIGPVSLYIPVPDKFGTYGPYSFFQAKDGLGNVTAQMYKIQYDVYGWRFVVVDKTPAWKDWSQEKRSIAVAALQASGWQGFITSMPEGGRLNPGDKVNAPTIVIPGQPEDDPNTPADERILRKEPGIFH